MSEIAIRYFKSRLVKLMTHKNTAVFVPYIQTVANMMNHSFHRAIKMRPVDVTKDNTALVLQNLRKYWGKDDGVEPASLSKTFTPLQRRLKVGQRVRIVLPRYAAFHKSYRIGYTDDIYKVTKVNFAQGPVTYNVENIITGDKLPGKFYFQELQLIS